MEFVDVCKKINSLEFSLKTICAVSVVHQVLEAVGVKRRVTTKGQKGKSETEAVGEAIEKVRKLKLPPHTKEWIASLVPPIFQEMNRWYNEYMFDCGPVWSPLGTVDLVQSTMSVVENPEFKVHYRYMVACAFCHKRQIFELAQLLTDEEVSVIGEPRSDPYYVYNLVMWGMAYPFIGPYWMSISRICDLDVSLWGPENGSPADLSVQELWNPLARFWLNVYNSRAAEPSGEDCHLSPEVWEDGLRIALSNCSDVAIKYFLDKRPPEAMLSSYDHLVHCRMDDLRCLSPTTYCSLISEISLEDYYIRGFAFLLLFSLAKWPYQPLFLDAARSLCVRAKKYKLFEILVHILDNALCEDFDYRELFIDFWELCAAHKPKWPGVSDWWSTDHALNAMLTEDERFIDFFFGKFSDRNREYFLVDEPLCSELIRKKKFHLLEPFIRSCGANRIDLLLKFESKMRLSRPDHCKLISPIVCKIVDEQ